MIRSSSGRTNRPGDLDEASAISIMDLFTEINRSLRQTMIMVTHNSVLAERATRVVRMQSGTIVPMAKS